MNNIMAQEHLALDLEHCLNKLERLSKKSERPRTVMNIK